MRDLMAHFVERRSAKRVNLNLETRLLHGGLEHADIVIGDLSFTGFNGETGAPLKKGDYVSVGLPNIGLVRATIKWRRGTKVAGAFHRAVDVRNCFREIAPRRNRAAD
ncbi:MAG: hypothetical protein JWN69_2550 [Alphaproteobacteria bacterium]|nr:hypothetical protein [Alphaproteobacteria bacterium]